MNTTPAIRRSRAAKTIAAIAALVFAFTALPSHAADEVYPSRPVRLIVTNLPGGQADGIARLLAQMLGSRLGQTVIVENRVGATGQIATDAVIKARPDGYTIMLASADTVLLPATRLTAPYDPVRDFSPVATLSSSPMVISIHPKVPAANLAELVAYAKANPGAIRYGSHGIGGVLHLIGEMLRLRAGIDIVHVPYKGGSEAATAVIAGQVEMGVMGIPSVSGRREQLRVLAQTGSARHPALTDVPTTREAGFAEVFAINWFGILAPSNTPSAITGRLNTEINVILAQENFKQGLLRFGAEPFAQSVGDYGRFIADDTKRWATVVLNAGVPRQ